MMIRAKNANRAFLFSATCINNNPIKESKICTPAQQKLPRKNQFACSFSQIIHASIPKRLNCLEAGGKEAITINIRSR
jgi:hypothetical protein